MPSTAVLLFFEREGNTVSSHPVLTGGRKAHIGPSFFDIKCVIGKPVVRAFVPLKGATRYSTKKNSFNGSIYQLFPPLLPAAMVTCERAPQAVLLGHVRGVFEEERPGHGLAVDGDIAGDVQPIAGGNLPVSDMCGRSVVW